MQNSLPKRIHDDRNELDYILQGDYYFPVIDDPSETRPIGRWGRMHKRYLEENLSFLEKLFQRDPLASLLQALPHLPTSQA